MTDNEVIKHYHEHGEYEQFHSEIKSHMDVERMPSGCICCAFFRSYSHFLIMIVVLFYEQQNPSNTVVKGILITL
jgi:hypothetical protein